MSMMKVKGNIGWANWAMVIAAVTILSLAAANAAQAKPHDAPADNPSITNNFSEDDPTTVSALDDDFDYDLESPRIHSALVSIPAHNVPVVFSGISSIIDSPFVSLSKVTVLLE